jgi:transaldolase
MDAVRSLIEAGLSVWLDPDARAGDAADDLVSWVAERRIGGVGPTLPPARLGVADARALSAFADADPLQSHALARSARLAERLADLLADVHAAGRGSDGLVQFPAPETWHDPSALVALADTLTALTRAANLVIGLPYAQAGLAAARQLVFRGVSVALGPVFTPGEYAAADHAYRRGLEQRLAAGRSLSGVVSLVWTPVGAIDEYATGLLGARTTEPLGGLGATIAQLIYLKSFRAFASPSWTRLRAAGAERPRPAFCDLPPRHAEAIERLTLPGSVIALGRRTIATFDESGWPPLAEPDETEVDWTVRQAARLGFSTTAVRQALRPGRGARSPT